MNVISVNLATEEYADKRRSLMAVSGCVLVVVVIAAITLNLFLANRSHIQTYQQKISGLKKTIADKRYRLQTQAGKYSSGEWATLQQQTLKANRMIFRDVFPWTRLLVGIEKIVPEGLSLESIDFSTDYTVVALKGRAVSSRKVSFFINRLEESRLFSENVLQKLHMGEGTGDGASPATDGAIKFVIESRMDAGAILVGRDFEKIRGMLPLTPKS